MWIPGRPMGRSTAAQSRGALVVALDMTQPFTAARARNAGLQKVAEGVEFVQFLDGDCALREGWIATARTFLEDHPDVAVVCGRRRERFPDASIYNRLIDREWDTPVGQALACGGDALMRVAPLRDLGGYRDSLIAGEEPELCVRLHQAGWQIWRLDAEMTWHDAEITRLSQWWKRSQRAGHAFAEGAALHGGPPERHWVAETSPRVDLGCGTAACHPGVGFVDQPLGAAAFGDISAADPALVAARRAGMGGFDDLLEIC